MQKGDRVSVRIIRKEGKIEYGTFKSGVVKSVNEKKGTCRVEFYSGGMKTVKIEQCTIDTPRGGTAGCLSLEDFN